MARNLLWRGFAIIDTSSVTAREFVLKADLANLRPAIRECAIADKRPSISLQYLVDADYIRQVPVDPATRANWAVHSVDFEDSPGQIVKGINDIHPGSHKTALDHTCYDTW